MMKTRAAILRRVAAPPYVDTKPLSIETIDLASPGPGEVLVKIAAAGLCHSDLSVINGERPRPLPMALGHEASGIVMECGPDVTDLVPGDHVVMVFMPSCGHCMPCAEGRPALCEPGAVANTAGTLLSGARRIQCEGVPVNHHLGVSAFAEHAVMSRRSMVKIDRDLPLEQAALFGCAVLTGVGAVVNTAHVPPGASVAVIGLGGVGLAALLGAVASGARQIVAIDLSDEKLALAGELGATDLFNARTDGIVDKIRAVTKGGVDFAFEMAGAAAAADLAYKIGRRGGTFVTAGLPPPTAALPVPLVNLVAEERTLKGSYIGSCVPIRDVPRFIGLYKAGRLPIDRLLSGIIALDDINEGFDQLARGTTQRLIVKM
jgi:alcohol dehydrogenase